MGTGILTDDGSDGDILPETSAGSLFPVTSDGSLFPVTSDGSLFAETITLGQEPDALAKSKLPEPPDGTKVYKISKKFYAFGIAPGSGNGGFYVLQNGQWVPTTIDNVVSAAWTALGYAWDDIAAGSSPPVIGELFGALNALGEIPAVGQNNPWMIMNIPLQSALGWYSAQGYDENTPIGAAIFNTILALTSGQNIGTDLGNIQNLVNQAMQQNPNLQPYNKW